MRCYVFCETLISLFLFWIFSSASGDSFSEKSILLEFKSSVSDPSGILGSWGFNDSEHHCSWRGVSCDSNSRVSELNIIGGCDGSGGNLQALSFPFYGFGIRKTCLNGGGKLGGRLSPLIGKLTELRVLSLAFNEFSGEIPVEIWGLERLEVLDLEGNSLSGVLPGQFAGMRDLRVLNLGFNRIGGEIPVSLSKCVNLEVMSLSGNRINGTIPGFFGGFPKLRGLYLSHNWLVGSIPGEFGQNCWNLEHLDLSGNFIVGKIPGSLGECLQLRTLLLFSNKLDGIIPREFGRLWRLEVLDVSRNSLSGPIPAELGDCHYLSVLVLKNLFQPMPINRNLREDSLDAKSDDNNFQGSIPGEITSLTKLKILWAPKANLVGELPRNWGSCDSLEMVNLAQNHFGGTMNAVFRACKNLHFLDLSSNKLIGKLDEKLAVPCMVTFDVSENLLSGIIPRFSHRGCPRIDSLDSTLVQTDDPSIAYVSFLTRKTRSVTPLPFSDASLAVIHNFGGNNFTGSIRWLPLARERFAKPIDYAFIASGNKLVGSFPRALFGKCGNLDGMIVNVRNNKLSGHIPLRVGTMCNSLRYLDASGNQISGSIPGTLRNMKSLVVLDLSGNKLQGKIPPGLHQLKHLKRLALSSNNLTGPIPSDFGLLRSLEMLELSSNSLCGEIPRGLQKLKNLTVLLLDKNKFSGSIPSGLANTASLSTFDASFNNLSGMISYSGIFEVNLSLRSRFIASRSVLSSDLPDSINGNSQGTAAPVTASDSKTVDDRMSSIEIASITSASAIVSVLLALLFLFFYTRKRVPNSRVQVYESREITIFTDIGVPVTFEKIVQATGSFNASNCIGNGGFGATYKAEISPSTLVAVKRLAVGRFHGVQQFHAEIKTLGSVRHPNLVTLIGYHASESERFLIYNYLPGGNLEDFIKKRSASTIDWKIIHKIALDIARALAYLHDQCAPRVLHRDVKPSNILLDNECNAYLSDFGLSRLLGTAESHATTGVAGTFGYVAPEYAMTCRVSEKSDVYSYGVVLLELISDKKALDPSFSSQGDGFNIVSWACMMLGRGQSKEVFTAGLWETGPHDSLVDMLHLAVMCTVETLSTRPTMKQVAQRLRQIRPMT